MREATDAYSALKTPPDDVLVGMYVNLAQAELWAGNAEAATELLHRLAQTIEDHSHRPAPGIQFEFRCGFAYQPGFHGRRTIEFTGIRRTAEPLPDFRDRVLSHVRRLLRTSLQVPTRN